MADAGYMLSGDFVRRLTRMVRAWEQDGGESRSDGVHSQILPGPPWQFGKLESALSTNNSANVWLYRMTNNTWSNTNQQQMAYAPPLLTSGNIASGKWVRLEYHLQAQRWYVVSAEC